MRRSTGMDNGPICQNSLPAIHVIASQPVLRGEVRQPAPEHEATNTNVRQTAPNDGLICLLGDIVHLAPAGTYTYNEVLAIG